jgi:hypothetical protein
MGLGFMGQKKKRAVAFLKHRIELLMAVSVYVRLTIWGDVKWKQHK